MAFAHAQTLIRPATELPWPRSNCRRRPRLRALASPRRVSMILRDPRPMPLPTDSLASTLHAIRASPIILCIRMDDPALALRAAQAAVRGGLLCVEVAMTTPHATRVMRQLAASCPHALVGAGTVLTVEDVAHAAAAGARFALSPVLDADVVARCHQLGVLAVPGAATPTEVWKAYYGAGARLVKIFPINLYGGLAFVKAMQGPLGEVPLLPTSGIRTDSLQDYLAAPNVWAVGASRQILPKDAVARGDWDAITEQAAAWAAIAAAHVARVQNSSR